MSTTTAKKPAAKAKKTVGTTSEIFTQIDTLYAEFVRCHNSDARKDKGLGRKTVNTMKKLFTPYNQASVTEGKVKKSK